MEMEEAAMSPSRTVMLSARREAISAALEGEGELIAEARRSTVSLVLGGARLESAISIAMPSSPAPSTRILVPMVRSL